MKSTHIKITTPLVKYGPVVPGMDESRCPTWFTLPSLLKENEMVYGEEIELNKSCDFPLDFPLNKFVVLITDGIGHLLCQCIAVDELNQHAIVRIIHGRKQGIAFIPAETIQRAFEVKWYCVDGITPLPLFEDPLFRLQYKS